MKKNIRNKCKALILALAMVLSLLPAVTLPAIAVGTTIYVDSTTGSDSGDGTSSSPYKTFTKGYSMASSGDTLDLTGTFTWTDADETGDIGMAGFTIDKNITIHGHDAGTTIIQAAENCGDNESRVFTVNSDVTVTFDNLEIRYGFLSRTETPDEEFYGGGGIELVNGDITISNCYIHDNKAAKMGFGIDSSKQEVTLTIDDSVISDNSSSNSVASNDRGGGIFTAGSTTITDSTISNNSGVSKGAGVYVQGTTLVMTNLVMTNCTVANNSSNQYGGGLYIITSAVTITNCTIARNSADQYGGGISMDSASSTLNIKNTIIAENTCNNADYADFDYVSGTITDNGYNIVEHCSNSSLFTHTDDLLGEQTSLGLSASLAKNDSINGTKTLALSSDSVAVDAGGSGTNGTVSVPSTDQRGLGRDANIDIGAYEYKTSASTAPTVTTQAVSDIESTTATGNGNITALGSPNPTAHGVCWSTSENPTTADSKTDKGAASATGAFTTSMTGLTANTTYYVRAYATNTAGTSYGTQVSFTTSAVASTVTTQAVSSISTTTATGNGNITALGSPNPTAHGVCWNTTGTPTTSDSKTDKGAASATGAFTTSMTGLTANTTYYVRAYATNTAGTSYGTQVTFKTSASTAETYTATVNTKVDGALTNMTSVKLKQSGETKYSASSSPAGVYTATVENGTYDIYINSEDTGADITIKDAAASKTVNYYTVSFKAEDDGTALGSTISATAGGSSISSGDVVFAGKKVVITAVGKGASTYTYAWTGDGTSNETTAALTVNSLSGKINAKCTVTGTTNNSSGGGDSGATVKVNGESYTAGESKTGTNENGQTQTIVTVETSKLKNILEKQGDGATVIIPVTTGSDVSAGVLTGEMISDMEQNGATLIMETKNAAYALPAEEIDIGEVSGQFGSDVSLADITVTVKIAEPSGETVTVVENAAEEDGFTIAVPAVDFTISCEYNGTTVEVSSFNSYVERRIAIPDGVDPEKITTGAVVKPDGTTYHVPTKIVKIDGIYYAVINSLTNSTYTVVWHPVEFSDVENHWAKDAINDMGSRMVLFGDGNGSYIPDNNMTRAEFAAAVVRTLGLAPETGESSFNDVSTSDWYYGFVNTANSYGIIEGYGNGKFGPNDTITREQAMTIIARAMHIIGFEVDLTDSEVNELLGAFSDRTYASAYAKDSIAACLKNGIVYGNGDNTIAPEDYVTRAEVAAMVQRLLQKSGMI